jgi:hypothetical protein
MATWNDDVRWEGTNDERLPAGGAHEGKQAVAQALGRIAESWDDFSVVPDEFIEEGDTLVVLGHFEGTAKATGTHTKFPFVHVYRMQGGKASKVMTLSDTLEVAKALGI